MRKILLCLLLITQGFSVGFMDRIFMSDTEIAEAERIEAEQAKRTKHFFGIEGGAGLIDLYARYNFLTTNPLFVGGNAPTLGYSVAINGGFQRYDYEKVGIRHTFGVKFDWGNNLGKFGGKQKEDYQGGYVYHIIPFYYVVEGLFDFVKSGDNRFGMNLGLSLKTAISIAKNIPYQPKRSKDLGGFGVFSELKAGFYTQFNNEIIDLNVYLPLLGMSFGTSAIPSVTATLGYKHLF